LEGQQGVHRGLQSGQQSGGLHSVGQHVAAAAFRVAKVPITAGTV